MEYKFDDITDNMIRLRTDRARIFAEQCKKEQCEREKNEVSCKSAGEVDKMEACKETENRLMEQRMDAIKRNEFLSNVKKSFLSECMFKLFKESSISPLTTSDTVVAKNLINSFINENGVNEILSDFKTKNLLLSEMNRITNKYYNKVLEACNKIKEQDNYDKYDIDTGIKDDFFKELEDVDIDDASKLIKHRVSDAMSEFIDDNVSNKMEYEDIINSAKDKMSVMNDEDMMEECANRAYLEVSRLKRNREKNIFNCLVESLSKQSFTNDTLKKVYFNESTSTLDMDSIVNSCQLMYTMLEMVNTTNMLKPITAEYLNDYLNSLNNN